MKEKPGNTDRFHLLGAISGKHALMAKLLYGCGLRLMECIRLRINNIDFGQGLILVHGGKGGKDRTTMLPKNLQKEVEMQIAAVKKLLCKLVSIKRQVAIY